MIENQRHTVIRLLGEEPECLDGTRLIKPSGLEYLEGPMVSFFRRSRAWLVETQVADEFEARWVGRRVQKALVSKRALTSADPYLHELVLYVTYSGGFIKLEQKD